MLNDTLFMVLCIVYSVSLGFSVISQGLPVLQILMTIFLWIVFAKNRNGNFTPDCVRYISGTIFASYVINWIFCGIMAVCGLIFFVLPFTVDMARFWDIVHAEVDVRLYDFLEKFTPFTNFFLFFVAGICIIAAIVSACLNVFGRRAIHRFVQSIYKNMEYGQIDLAKRGTAQVWMMVFGVLDGVSAVLSLAGGHLISFVGGGCLAAAYIMGSVLVKRYFGDIQ